MFAVPEVDDDNNPSPSSVENTKPILQSEITTESLPSSPPPPPPSSSTPISIIEKEEKTSVTTEVAPSATTKQHLSRLSLFQRNTIHVCEQIPDHM